MNRKRLIGSIAAACAAAALTAGIAEGSGTTTQSSTATTPSTTSGTAMPGHDGHGGPPGGHGPGRDVVHSVDIVLNKAKSAYITETTDEGTVESIDSSGGSITLLEGTKALPYKSVTVTVPSGATVTFDGKSSTLAALVAGDRVSVRSSSDGTDVMAMDSSFKPEGGMPPAGANGHAPPGEGSAAPASPSTSGATTSG
ncbi:MAG TPA: hypothetical protein VG188_14120 [Solirubrobacteraceae bacterium]|jgi:hypothetical protein|nr:hypothetical protein [Solirubrobacteraceae bacterium]